MTAKRDREADVVLLNGYKKSLRATLFPLRNRQGAEFKFLKQAGKDLRCLGKIIVVSELGKGACLCHSRLIGVQFPRMDIKNE